MKRPQRILPTMMRPQTLAARVILNGRIECASTRRPDVSHQADSVKNEGRVRGRHSSCEGRQAMRCGTTAATKKCLRLPTSTLRAHALDVQENRKGARGPEARGGGRGEEGAAAEAKRASPAAALKWSLGRPLQRVVLPVPRPEDAAHVLMGNAG